MNLVKTQNTTNVLIQFINSFVSPQTRRSYSNDLKGFFEFVGPLNSPADLQPIHISAFRDKIAADGASTATINRKISTIKSLTRWLIQNGHLTTDPTISVKVPKVVHSRSTEAFKDEEVAKILEIVEDISHKTLLMTLFYTGLRRSEVVKLSPASIVQQSGLSGFKVIGKGGKERLVAIPEELTKQLNIYFQRTRIGDFLFEMDESTVYRIVKRYAAKAGVKGRFGAHSCRATVISNLLDNQVPIRDVANFAGHSSVNTTTLYDKKRKGLADNAGYKIRY
jgi:integrase/recombinase XerD